MVFLAKYNNLAGWCSGLSLLLCLGQSAGYFLQRDYRRGLYFLFAFAITLTVVL
jgi:hypothetical protein